MKQVLRKIFDTVTLPLFRQPLALKVLRQIVYQHKRAKRQVIEHHLRANGSYGDVVQRGPLAGLKYLPPERYASCRFEKIIGAYEHEIYPWLTELAATRQYTTVLNVGAAEGFFTAGLARLFPKAKVLSYESTEEGRDYCGELIKLNEVADRVEIHGTCTLEEFAAVNPNSPTLLMMDIDLGERLLLDLDKVPWLRHADVLVETHDCLKEGTTRLIIDRFAHSHNIRQVTSAGLPYANYPILRPLLFEDIQAMVGDDRRGLQDWLLMQPKQ
ncbi:MAG: hypothetical protein JWO89_2688 [Verrucomicrobiaceae bacterium]|nr:hypothetical protein [Verrucomicrobiaceae bacterium]